MNFIVLLKGNYISGLFKASCIEKVAYVLKTHKQA